MSRHIILVKETQGQYDDIFNAKQKKTKKDILLTTKLFTWCPARFMVELSQDSTQSVIDTIQKAYADAGVGTEN